MDELEKEVRELFASDPNPETIEKELLQMGFLKDDIDRAIHTITGKILSDKKHEKSKLEGKFFLKEIFDRIGFGFGSEQYINILFLLSGASYFLIAIINGIRAMISSGLSSYIRDYTQKKGVSKRLLSYSGLSLGLAFIFMAVATYFRSVSLFVFALIAGSVGVVAYGEFYQSTLKETLREEKRGRMELVYKYGLVITILSLLIGAGLMDRLELYGITLTLLGMELSSRFLGYFFAFGIAALFFILAGYVLCFINQGAGMMNLKDLLRHMPEYAKNLDADMKSIIRKKKIFILVIAGSMTGMVQILGNSFYGIFIYDHFQNYGFGGFMNVAMISILALLVSLMTPHITRSNSKAYGKYPMLIFGTVLMAIMPLAFYYNPNLVSLGIGTILGVMGAAILGIANGLLSQELLPPDIKGNYFSAYTILTIIPYFLTVPLGAALVHFLGIQKMLLFLGLILLVLVAPLYFVLLLFPNIDSRQDPRPASPPGTPKSGGQGKSTDRFINPANTGGVGK